MRSAAIVLGAVLVLGAAGVAGYLLGHDSAPDAEDASEERAQVYESTFGIARVEAAREARISGRREGVEEGREAGARSGTAAGAEAGDATAQEELAAIEAAEAEEAALAEAQERAENCGAPLFVEGYCPTDEEIAQENLAESLCGPGTPEGEAEAAEHGIQC